ncbi:MAG: S-layer homology domain-containing protein [Cyanobacteria bacterium J06626_18]
MQTPPGSNLPDPRSPRDKDEWIAVVIALGILGGTAGWIITNSSSALQSDGIGANLFGLEQLDDPLSEDRAAIETESDSAHGDPIRSTRDNVETEDADAQSAFQRLLDDNERRSPIEGSPSQETPSPATDSAVDNAPAGVVIPAPDTELAGEEPETEEPETTDAVTVPEPRLPEDVTAAPLIREPLAFSDLPEDHWGKPYIDALTSLGILNGLPDGTYAPDRPMTRAELAVQVAQAFEIDRGLPPETFTDIPPDYWATETIEEAVTTGFMTGYPDDVFRPDQTVPRTQVLVTLATGLTLPDASTEILQPYEDQSEIPEWARAKVASAIDAGLIDASPDDDSQLRPNNPATRAEVAAMLHSALVRLGRVEPIE